MWVLQTKESRSKVDLGYCTGKLRAPSFCIPKTKGYGGTLSRRSEARRGLIHTPVEQQIISFTPNFL